MRAFAFVMSLAVAAAQLDDEVQLLQTSHIKNADKSFAQKLDDKRETQLQENYVQGEERLERNDHQDVLGLDAEGQVEQEEEGHGEEAEGTEPGELQRKFDGIYQEHTWQRGSGPGSYVENTAGYRTFLQQFMKDHAIASVVDAGCGDWQSTRLVDWRNIAYHGVDISTEALTLARRNYQSNTKHPPRSASFKQGSVDYDLPAADLLISKDVLQHLPNEDIQSFLDHNIRSGKFKYALLTNDFDESIPNADIPSVGYRTLDLRKAPFNVALEQVYQSATFGNKRTFLWSAKSN